VPLEGLQHLHAGKVRDLYAVGDDLVLIVASDRISAYDHVLSTPIPDKGIVLTQLSVWWLGQLDDIVSNHLVTADVDDYPIDLRRHATALRGRSMLCRRLAMVPIEAVARGYLSGSARAAYSRSGSVYGNPLPAGLAEGSRLPEPIFTPTTKAPVGEHDQAMSFDDVVALAGAEVAARLRDLTLSVYEKAHALALERGLILADTKLEFGQDESGALVLADEVLTPDSSRFWPAASWAPGGPQPSFDKQYVRDWLVSAESGWSPASDKPPPALPPEVVGETRAKYTEAYRLLTGSPVPFL
jgi:phosphoribosylaminoimidazole-succinocarboxamide synthase